MNYWLNHHNTTYSFGDPQISSFQIDEAIFNFCQEFSHFRRFSVSILEYLQSPWIDIRIYVRSGGKIVVAWNPRTISCSRIILDPSFQHPDRHLLLNAHPQDGDLLSTRHLYSISFFRVHSGNFGALVQLPITVSPCPQYLSALSSILHAFEHKVVTVWRVNSSCIRCRKIAAEKRLVNFGDSKITLVTRNYIRGRGLGNQDEELHFQCWRGGRSVGWSSKKRAG